MQRSRDRTPRLGSEASRPWVYWLLAVICLCLGLTALLELVVPVLPAEVALVTAGSRPNWSWLLVGLALVGGSLFFTWRAYRWQPPLVDRVRAEKGLLVQLELGAPGATGQIHARLKHLAGIQEPLAAWKVELSALGAELGSPEGLSTGALAYFDPQSGMLSAVSTEGRLYSVLPDKVSIVPADSP